MGKLNLVEAPGKGPCLVLDSAVCQVNRNCSLPEAVRLPTVSDVRFSSALRPTQYVDGSQPCDFKAAHKKVKVRKEDPGLLLFEFANQLYGYVVCYFGARFSN